MISYVNRRKRTGAQKNHGHDPARVHPIAATALLFLLLHRIQGSRASILPHGSHTAQPGRYRLL